VSFDIYTRVSDEDGRSGPSFGSPEEQEATCRAWAEREAVEVDEVAYDGNVSGATKVDDRELGRLVRKVENGESEGVVVRYIDRYARDMIEGALTLTRIVAAGGRLAAPDSGFDSANLNSDTRMVFNIQLAIAEAQRERNNENRRQGIRRAADRGCYLASRPPSGYDRRDGVLSIQPSAKELIREAFTRRAEGETFAGIATWLREVGANLETVDEWMPSKSRPDGKRVLLRPFASITENGIRHVIASRAYVGEVIVPTGVRGKPETRTGGAWAVISQQAWERANAVTGCGENTGALSAQVLLGGLARCKNGHRMSVGKSGSGPAYLCTHANCNARAGISAEALDAYVASLLGDALLHREPHVSAIMEGDNRYQDALEAIEDARQELEAFVVEVSVVEIGKEAWARGRAARQAKLDAARAFLKTVPEPKPRKLKKGKPMAFEEAEPGLMRVHYRRFVARVVVEPVGRGKRVAVASRAKVYWIGATEAAAFITPHDKELPEALKAHAKELAA